MGVLAKIAYRNLREHKTKTIIIGSLITLGMIILVVGNSVLDTATAGIEANYTENYTGHVIVAAKGVEAPALTPDGAAQSMENGVPIIPDYPRALDFVQSYPGVVAVNPIITGFALAQQDGEGFGIMQYYGVEPDTYRNFFPNNLEMIDGHFLEPGQKGVVISEQTLDMLRESSNRDIGVGDSILLTSQSRVYGMKIREVDIVGIFKFRNASLPLNFISFVDLEDVRILGGMTGITNLETGLSESERKSLGNVNEDALFGGSGEDGSSAGSADSAGTAGSATATAGVATAAGSGGDDDLFGGGLVSDLGSAGGSGSRDFDNILGDTSVRASLSAVNENAWHYILVKLDNERMAKRVVRDMNAQFQEQGLELTAFEWLDGGGALAQFTYVLKTVFNILIIVVAVVAVIIIMNTLVISVTERIPEIGTMRAIGAQRRFVRRMILLETLMLAVVFGVIGIVIGAGITTVLGLTGIQSDNMLLQVFMGGPVLNPVVSAGSVISSLIAVVAAGMLASLYPAAIALRIQPVTAMNAS